MKTRINWARRERSRADLLAAQNERCVRVRLQADVEEHEQDVEAERPAGRWAMCKLVYRRPELDEDGKIVWDEKGDEFPVWDPWSEGGYELTEGTDAIAHYVRWGVNRFEFLDAPCA